MAIFQPLPISLAHAGMSTIASKPRHQDLFALRVAIARLGESDAFNWWSSYAMTEAGEYALPRIFRRAPELTAAHLSLLAARLRHDQGVPKEPLVHLFNFGEAFEGAFERWLIGQKADGWQPDLPMVRPAGSVADVLRKAGIEPAAVQPSGDRVLLGSVKESEVENPVARKRIATRLAAAYAASDLGRLVIPYFRLER